MLILSFPKFLLRWRIVCQHWSTVCHCAMLAVHLIRGAPAPAVRSKHYLHIFAGRPDCQVQRVRQRPQEEKLPPARHEVHRVNLGALYVMICRVMTCRIVVLMAVRFSLLVPCPSDLFDRASNFHSRKINSTFSTLNGYCSIFIGIITGGTQLSWWGKKQHSQPNPVCLWLCQRDVTWWKIYIDLLFCV